MATSSFDNKFLIEDGESLNQFVKDLCEHKAKAKDSEKVSEEAAKNLGLTVDDLRILAQGKVQ
jgi:hypothetical protein